MKKLLFSKTINQLNFIYVNYVNANLPSSFEEAMASRDYKNWQKAMDSEINSLNKNKTWILVDDPLVPSSSGT